MKYTFGYLQASRVPTSFVFAALIFGCSFLSNAKADPTLVVDVDTGVMEIHVGDTSGIAPITGTIWGCSWDGVGACTPALTPGNWPDFTGWQLVSSASSLSADGNSAGFPGDVPGLNVLANTVGGYAEFTFSLTNFAEPQVIPLSKTFNTSIDVRDLHFSSVNGAFTTQWNTIYVGAIPEPNTMALVAVGTMGLSILRRRR